MFSISKHISSLLLEHNCVIVPDLGGFVAQYVPAHFDAKSEKFFPPTRLVAFNADLTMNDGLLVQSLMQTYDATFPEMQKAVEDKVSAIKEQLFTTGQYDLPGIGRLMPNVEGRTEFEPATDGLLSPSLYGLEYIAAKPAKHNEDGISLSRGLIRRDGNGYVVRIHRQVANMAAAAVCALFCYFSWNTSATSETQQPHEARLFSTELFQSLQEDKPEVHASEVDYAQAQQAKAPSMQSEEQTTEEARPAAEENNATNDLATKPFALVLVSGLSQQYAQAFLQRLQTAGLTDGRVVADGKYFGVYYGGFNTFAEAATFLQAHKGLETFQYGYVKEMRRGR